MLPNEVSGVRETVAPRPIRGFPSARGSVLTDSYRFALPWPLPTPWVASEYGGFLLLISSSSLDMECKCPQAAGALHVSQGFYTVLQQLAIVVLLNSKTYSVFLGGSQMGAECDFILGLPFVAGDKLAFPTRQNDSRSLRGHGCPKHGR